MILKNVSGYIEMSNAEILIRKLVDKNFTITTAESCTGGMIASSLIDVPGASLVVNECHITYSNEAKMKYLGVNKETLDNYTAVSEETAIEMVMGASKLADADVAIAVTGLAGPDGGTEEKLVGLVYIACKVEDRIRIDKPIFDGNRNEIRTQATEYAINMALDMLR